MEDDDMRERADWMSPGTDDPALEFIRDVGAAMPKEVSKTIGKSREHTNRRLAVLYRYGLLDRPQRGIYRITDAGRDYLDEKLDASTLEERDDDS